MRQQGDYLLESQATCKVPPSTTGRVGYRLSTINIVLATYHTHPESVCAQPFGYLRIIRDRPLLSLHSASRENDDKGLRCPESLVDLRGHPSQGLLPRYEDRDLPCSWQAETADQIEIQVHFMRGRRTAIIPGNVEDPKALKSAPSD